MLWKLSELRPDVWVSAVRFVECTCKNIGCVQAPGQRREGSLTAVCHIIFHLVTEKNISEAHEDKQQSQRLEWKEYLTQRELEFEVC